MPASKMGGVQDCADFEASTKDVHSSPTAILVGGNPLSQPPTSIAVGPTNNGLGKACQSKFNHGGTPQQNSLGSNPNPSLGLSL
jgi:hypothetical protein